MHYVESGPVEPGHTGPPLLLLHAFPVDHQLWDGARAQLAEHARVIAADQRGLGRSPLGDPPQEPDLDRVAADVLALLDGLGLDQVVVGGCSMGGYAAMALLRAAPERVSAVLLVNTKADADTADAADGRLKNADRAERAGITGWLADETVPNVLGATTREQRPDVVARVRDLINAQPPDGVAWALRAMARRPDSSEVLRSFPRPALVLAGEEDALAPPEVARRMAETMPAGEFASIPAAGHLPPVETPEAFVAAVRPWLARIS